MNDASKLSWRPFDDFGLYFLMINEDGLETSYKVKVRNGKWQVWVYDDLRATYDTVHQAMFATERIYVHGYDGGVA